jgi:hypothetical protein
MDVEVRVICGVDNSSVGIRATARGHTALRAERAA